MWNVIGVLILFLGAAPSQAPTGCLHGPAEPEAQRARRLAAIQYIRQANEAQLRARQEQGTYVALGSLGLIAIAPTGFVPRLTFDQWNYQISLKDLFDPCGFALFSDQDGVVYAAQPVQPSEGPS